MIARNPSTGAYPDISGTRCLSIIVPDADEYVRLLAGMYGLLCEPINWDGADDERDSRAALILAAHTETDWEACLKHDWYLYRQRIFPVQFNVGAGNAIAWNQAAAADGAGWWWQSPPANNDSRNIAVALRAGTYQIAAMAAPYSGGGKVDVAMNGAYVVTFDMYNSSTLYNHIFTTNGVVVAADGIHTLNMTVNGKSASSSGYGVLLSWLDFVRYGD